MLGRLCVSKPFKLLRTGLPFISNHTPALRSSTGACRINYVRKQHTSSPPCPRYAYSSKLPRRVLNGAQRGSVIMWKFSRHPSTRQNNL